MSYETIPNKDLVNSHQETRRWLSDIKFWSDELEFFRQLIESYSLSARFNQDKLQKLRHRVDYYENELINHFQRRLLEHENKLANMVNGQYTYYDSYSTEHANLSGHLNSFRQEFRMFIKELYDEIVLAASEKS